MGSGKVKWGLVTWKPHQNRGLELLTLGNLLVWVPMVESGVEMEWLIMTSLFFTRSCLIFQISNGLDVDLCCYPWVSCSSSAQIVNVPHRPSGDVARVGSGRVCLDLVGSVWKDLVGSGGVWWGLVGSSGAW